MKDNIQKACFAAGCFWGVEYVFTQFSGILSVKSGYTGGNLKNPSYEDVCSGKTGHAESVLIEFNSNEISYKKLLEIFFKSHDPTTLNYQGPDVGNQYRSAIFYFSDKQKREAESFKKKYEKILKKKIVTLIEQAKEFYDAEEYHQKYYEKSGKQPYCHVVPKIKI